MVGRTGAGKGSVVNCCREEPDRLDGQGPCSTEIDNPGWLATYA